jgi:maltose alpha-D-glucosyltransferase/alpha-amylase
MQWNSGKNRGFSSAEPEALYLPVDPAPDAPTVEAQERDPASLLNTVKALLRLRRAEADLASKPNLEILRAGPEAPFIYRRGSFVIAVNPGSRAAGAPLGVMPKARAYALGTCALENGACRMEGQSFGIWRV